jgi:hypothetical protein
MGSTRKATHAGSWYTSNRTCPSLPFKHKLTIGSNLESELAGYLAKVTPLPDLKFEPPLADAKAIIAP